MRKILTILLAVAMMSALAIPACAADTYHAGSGSTTTVSLDYQSDIEPGDEDPDTPVDPDNPDYPDPDKPDPGEPDPEQPDPGTLKGTYAICVPANITMDKVVKIENGAVYLSGEGTIKCIQYSEGSGLANDATIDLYVESQNDFKVMDGNDELCSYELKFGSEGAGIDTDYTQGEAYVGEFATEAFAKGSTVVVNLNATDSNIYGDVSVDAGDLLTWSYSADDDLAKVSLESYI